jgi:hypothetical protein
MNMTARALWKSAIVAGLAAIIPLGLNSPARANIIVTVTEVGGPTAGPTTIAVGLPTDNSGAGIQSVPFNGLFGNFSIQNGSAGESQTSTVSQAFTTALNLTNNAATTKTLEILIQATGFTAPIPVAAVTSSFGGTTFGGPNSGSFQSSIGAVVGQNAQTLQTPTLDPSFNNTVFGAASGLAAPFSIFQRTTFTVAAGGQINFTGRTILVAPVPEPATSVMALTGLPLLGFGAIVRRRRLARS